MKRVILCLLFLGVVTTTTNAQVQFLLQNRSKSNYTKVFDDINATYAAAAAGDTIYVPGAKNAGGFTFTNNKIDKKLHWIGVGTTNADTPVTGRSIINNAQVIFTNNASGSTIEGMRFYKLKFGESETSKCNNIILKRCIFKEEVSVFGDNFIMTGCLGYNEYIESTSGGNRRHTVVTGNQVSNNCLLKNNILFTAYRNSGYGANVVYIYGFNHSIFSYNTMNGYRAYIQATNSCQANNNIIMSQTAWSADSYSNVALRFNNCAFWLNSFPYTPTEIRPEKTIGNHCIKNLPIKDVFVRGIDNWGTSHIYDEEFIITKPDFHLKDGPCKTASTTGGEIGAYGDKLYSYKPIPFFPHIKEAAIGFSVYTKNNKQVIDAKVKVEAQSR